MHEVYVAFTGAIASVVSRRRRSYSINTKNELIDAKYDVDPGPVHPLARLIRQKAPERLASVV